jgi:hypothetical protein
MLSRFAVLAGRSLARVSATKPPCYPALLKSARFYGSVRTSSTQSSVSNELIEALENEIKAEKGLEKENLGGAVRPGGRFISLGIFPISPFQLLASTLRMIRRRFA